MVQTMAEHLIEQGEKRGETRGETRAKQAAVVKLLQLRFNEVPESRYQPDYLDTGFLPS